MPANSSACRLEYSWLEGRFAICQLPAGAAIPEWASTSGIFSITRTASELSIVCEEAVVPPGARAESGWVCLQLHGPFPFAMTGILAAILNPLAEAGIGIFAVSTFDTDYVLIQEARLRAADLALQQAGHRRIP